MSTWNISDLDAILDSLKSRKKLHGSFRDHDWRNDPTVLVAKEEIGNLKMQCESIQRAMMEAKKSSSSNTLTDLVTAIQLACDAAAMALILNGIEKDFTAASLTMSMLPPEKKNGGDENGDLNLLDACVLTLVSTLETLFLKTSRHVGEGVLKSTSARMVLIGSLSYFNSQDRNRDKSENLHKYAIDMSVDLFEAEARRCESLAKVLEYFSNLNDRVAFFDHEGPHGYNLELEAGDSFVSSKVLDMMKGVGSDLGHPGAWPIFVLSRGLSYLASALQRINFSILMVSDIAEDTFQAYEREVAEKKGRGAPLEDSGKKAVDEKQKEKERKALKERIDKARRKRDEELLRLFETLHPIYSSLISILTAALPSLAPAKTQPKSLLSASDSDGKGFMVSFVSSLVSKCIAENAYFASAVHRFANNNQREKLELDRGMIGFLKIKKSLLSPALELFGKAADHCSPSKDCQSYFALTMEYLLKQEDPELTALAIKLPQFLFAGCVFFRKGLVKKARELLGKDYLVISNVSKDILEESQELQVIQITSVLSFLMNQAGSQIPLLDAQSIPWEKVETLLASAQQLLSVASHISELQGKNKVCKEEISRSVLWIHRQIAASILTPLIAAASKIMQMRKGNAGSQPNVLKMSESILNCIELALLIEAHVSLPDPEQRVSLKKGLLPWEARLVISCQLDTFLGEIVDSADGAYNVLGKTLDLSLSLLDLIMVQMPPLSSAPSPAEESDFNLVQGWWSIYLTLSGLPSLLTKAILVLPIKKSKELRPSLCALLLSIYLQLLPLAALPIQERSNWAPLIFPQEALEAVVLLEKLSEAVKSACSPSSSTSYRTPEKEVADALVTVALNTCGLLYVGSSPHSFDWLTLYQRGSGMSESLGPLWPPFLDRPWGKKAGVDDETLPLQTETLKCDDPRIDLAKKGCQKRASRAALFASIPSSSDKGFEFCAAGVACHSKPAEEGGAEDLTSCHVCQHPVCLGCHAAGGLEGHPCEVVKQLSNARGATREELLSDLTREITLSGDDFLQDRNILAKIKEKGGVRFLETDGKVREIRSPQDVQNLRLTLKIKRLEELMRAIAEGEGNDRDSILEMSRILTPPSWRGKQKMEDFRSSIAIKVRRCLFTRSQHRILSQARPRQSERRRELARCEAEGEETDLVLVKLKRSDGVDEAVVTREEESLLRGGGSEAGAGHEMKLSGAEEELFRLFLRQAEMDSDSVRVVETPEEESEDDIMRRLAAEYNQGKYKQGKWEPGREIQPSAVYYLNKEEDEEAQIKRILEDIDTRRRSRETIASLDALRARNAELQSGISRALKGRSETDNDLLEELITEHEENKQKIQEIVGSDEDSSDDELDVEEIIESRDRLEKMEEELLLRSKTMLALRQEKERDAEKLRKVFETLEALKNLKSLDLAPPPCDPPSPPPVCDDDEGWNDLGGPSTIAMHDPDNVEGFGLLAELLMAKKGEEEEEEGEGEGEGYEGKWVDEMNILGSSADQGDNCPRGGSSKSRTWLDETD